MTIKLPRLLDGQMREIDRLHPLRLSIEEDALPVNTASMTLSEDAPEVKPGAFVELFLPGRSAGIYRVESIRTDYFKKTRTLTLEHGIVTLGDAFIPGRHEFFGWDDGDPETTITGYRVLQDVYKNGLNTWYSIMMTFNNRDGSQVRLGFSHGQAVPVVALTEKGWRIPVSQPLIDMAWVVDGTWDGYPTAGLIASDHLAECVLYRDAAGMTKRYCTSYHRPFMYSNDFNDSGAIESNTPVNVHAESTDKNGVKFYAVDFTRDGRKIDTFVLADDVDLYPGYTIEPEPVQDENHIEKVTAMLIGAAHKQDTGWSFGESDFAESYGYVFEDANLLEAVQAIPARLEGQYVWEFDQSGWPWRLNLRRAARNGIAELRASRNLESLQVTVSTANMVTCVYPIGANGLTVEGVNGGSRYVTSENMQTYWHAEKILTTDDDTPDKLYESAILELNTNSEPEVSMTLSARDLCSATGEPLDRLVIGKMCRIPLPDEGMTVTGAITHLSYTDVYGKPDMVNVTLANRAKTASDLIAMLMKKG